jgi:alpha-glucosidase
MLLLTLRGTPTMYYGDEIGMADVPIPPERVQDPFEKNVPGIGVGRDPCRTPMQWDASRNAGFTEGEPWLPIADNYQVMSVEPERDDPSSMLALYRRLLALRRQHDALSIGDYVPIAMTGDLLAYIRSTSSERFLIALNLGREPHALTLSALGVSGRTVLSTHLDLADEAPAETIALRADEGVIVALDPG